MNLVIDYAFTHPSTDQLKAVGAVGVMRYLTASRGSSKLITAPELGRLHAAGLGVGFVWETTADRSRGGAAAGAADGHRAAQLLRDLSVPTSTPVFYAIDFDAQPGQLPLVKAYLAAADQADGIYPAGVYGSFAVIEACVGDVVHWGWQTVAWSHKHLSRKIALYQHAASPLPDSDANDLIDAGALWFPAGTPADKPKPKPVHQEDDVTKIVRVKETGTLWVINAVGRRSVTQKQAALMAIADYAHYDDGGVPFEHPKATVELVPVLADPIPDKG